MNSWLKDFAYRIDIQWWVFVLAMVAALLVASPALQRILVYPQTEFFTELWLLGPGHMAEGFPYNVTSGESYNIYLGAANHLGEVSYYSVQVKFRNSTQSAPDSFNRTYSSMPALYTMYLVVPDKELREVPLTFGFDYRFQDVTRVVYRNVTIPGGPGENDTIVQVPENVVIPQVVFDRLRFNDVSLSLEGYTSDWDPEKGVFFGNLFFELWIFDNAADDFRYHERYVDLKVNMTAPQIEGLLEEIPV